MISRSRLIGAWCPVFDQLTYRVGAGSSGTGPGLIHIPALIHIPLTAGPLPALGAGAGEVTRGGLSAGAAMHAGQGLALGNVGLAGVALVTREAGAGEAGQVAGADAAVLTRRVSAEVGGHTGVTRVPGQTHAGHTLSTDLTPGVCWTLESLAPGLGPDLAPLSLVSRGAGAGGGLARHAGAAIQTEAGQTRVSSLEWNIIKIEILLQAPPRFWSQNNTLTADLDSNRWSHLLPVKPSAQSHRKLLG